MSGSFGMSAQGVSIHLMHVEGFAAFSEPFAFSFVETLPLTAHASHREHDFPNMRKNLHISIGFCSFGQGKR